MPRARRKKPPSPPSSTPWAGPAEKCFVDRLLGAPRGGRGFVVDEPADETDRLIYRDWLQDKGLFYWEHVLGLVLAYPDCDAFRLLAADVLEEEGKKVQAEFVRLDVGMAALEPEIKVGFLSPGPKVKKFKVSSWGHAAVKGKRDGLWVSWANGHWNREQECPVPDLDWQFWRKRTTPSPLKATRSCRARSWTGCSSSAAALSRRLTCRTRTTGSSARDSGSAGRSASSRRPRLAPGG